MSTFPIVISSAGYVPQTPAALNTLLIQGVSATNPDYTANLPGSLIEDISSTSVYALLVCDAALAEAVNNVSPFNANEFILGELGQVYGLEVNSGFNTSVDVVFSGTPGYVVAQGFTVSDGTYQYVVQDGGVVASNGQSSPLFAVATQSGAWAVPSGTVTQFITSVPSGVTLSVSNPQPGVPASSAENATSYRSRVLQAGLAASQGMARYLKTLLGKVSGVQQRLISVRQLTETQQWEIIVGGGDPYEVAYAIYSSLFDVSSLSGSIMEVTAITAANPGRVTTDINHGFSTGDVVVIRGIVGPTALNNTPLTVTVVNPTQFTIGVNTSGMPAYVSGGVVTPNPRNVTVSISDYPDAYSIVFVNPPQESVGLTVLWDTDSPNFVNPASIAQLAGTALVTYVNSIAVGQPIILYELQSVFQAAVANILPPQLLTRLVFEVSINGVGVVPVSGTGIIAGDPESYFLTSIAQVSVQQG